MIFVSIINNKKPHKIIATLNMVSQALNKLQETTKCPTKVKYEGMTTLLSLPYVIWKLLWLKVPSGCLLKKDYED